MRTLIQIFTVVLAGLALLGATGAAAPAAPPPQLIHLDTSFGPAHDGRVTTDVGGPGIYSYAEEVAVQPDGRTVVAGWGGGLFRVARYLTNGDLDKSFGPAHTGIVLTAFPNVDNAQLHGLKLQRDGKIVVAGWAHPIGTANHMVVLARYNFDGSLDQTFGTGGRVETLGPNTLRLEANALVIQPDGKIVVAGDHMCGGVTVCWNIALVRYEPDGSLDSSFGRGGIALSSGPGYFASALALQPDGKLVVAGQDGGGTLTPSTFVLQRFDASGNLDVSFGHDGSMLTSFGARTNAGATALLVRPDGKLVVAGWEEFGPGLSSRQGVLVQYESDGSLDRSFGTAGWTDVVLGVSHTTRDVSLVGNKDGTFVLASGSQDDSQTLVALGDKFSLALVTPDGHQLPPFYTTGFSGGGDARALALQPNGNVVAAGGAARGQFGVARYVQAPRPCFSPTPPLTCFTGSGR